MIVHSRFSGVVLRSRWIDGSATFTTVLSSMIMKSAKHMAASVHHLWFARSSRLAFIRSPWDRCEKVDERVEVPREARECLLAVDGAHEARSQAEAEEQHRDGRDIGVGADAPVGATVLDGRAHAGVPGAHHVRKAGADLGLVGERQREVAQARDLGHPGIAHQAAHVAEVGREEISALGGRGREALSHEARAVLEHGAEERLLGGEVLVDHRLGAARRRGDVARAGAAEAVAREQHARRGDDRRAAVLGAQALARGRLLVCPGDLHRPKIAN